MLITKFPATLYSKLFQELACESMTNHRKKSASHSQINSTLIYLPNLVSDQNHSVNANDQSPRLQEH